MTPSRMRKVNIAIMCSEPRLVDLQVAVLRAAGVQNFLRITQESMLRPAFDHFRYDLLIVNEIGRINVEAAIRQVRNPETFGHPFVTALLMTANTTRSRIRRAAQLGYDDVARIPFTGETLLGKIHQLSRMERQFIRVGDYFGPDRRRRDDGPPMGLLERRADLRPDIPEGYRRAGNDR